MATDFLSLAPAPIKFGTDGWRGVLGVDITIDRLLAVAAASAQELLLRAPSGLNSRTIVIGFDRRFLAPELARAISAAVQGSGLDPLLAEGPAPTPACSWAVLNRKALGALVITASHNPPEWLGLKIKGPFGGSVEGDFTKAVEKRLLINIKTPVIESSLDTFDPRKEHLEGLKNKVDIFHLVKRLKELKIKVIVDPMHGSAARCLSDLIGGSGNGLLEEIRSERDAFFGGNPPEPLRKYLGELIEKVRVSNARGQLAIGLAFDGDGDRIAAVDEKGRFCSTQLLIPLLVDHLGRERGLSGCVVKTVSGSDLISLIANQIGREVIEVPVGFKYIASKMMSADVLVGGEESGGVGFGTHLPERDALYVALILLEALAKKGCTLGAYIDSLQNDLAAQSYYERIDLRLANMKSRHKLENLLEDKSPKSILGMPIKKIIRIDGVKLRLGDCYWLMMRFSGTEPLLRLYCEAPTKDKALEVLGWAKNFAEEATCI